MNKLGSAIFSRLVIIIPYAWLLFFFLIPFFIVFRISLSTTAIAQPPYEPAFAWSDGLSGIWEKMGQFSFDIMGRTAFVYASVVMIIIYALLKLFVNSPLGLVAQGIRENPVRMRLIGVPVYSRLLTVYVLAAAVAGVAGALSAQVNSIVGMDALGFTLSANVLVMLALGGTGRLYGAFFGAIVFMILSDRAAAIDPTNWLAALGVLLILIVRFAPDGIAGLLQRLTDRWRPGRTSSGLRAGGADE